MSEKTIADENTTTKELPMVVQFPGSLRDWFAGQALAGLLASDFQYDLRRVSDAYQIADAMLAESEKSK